MLRRSLFASALMLASTVAFAPIASADTASVTFNGSIPGACTFDNATASGSLVPYSGNYYLMAHPYYGGSYPTLNVTCNTAGSVSITGATPSSSNPVATSVYTELFQQGSSVGNSASIAGGTSVPVSVAMYAYSQNGSALPSGNYQYTVTLTATGN